MTNYTVRERAKEGKYITKLVILNWNTRTEVTFPGTNLVKVILYSFIDTLKSLKFKSLHVYFPQNL